MILHEHLMLIAEVNYFPADRGCLVGCKTPLPVAPRTPWRNPKHSAESVENYPTNLSLEDVELEINTGLSFL